MQNDRLVVAVGAMIVLAVLALAAYVVNRLVPGQPTVAAGDTYGYRRCAGCPSSHYQGSSRAIG